MAVAGRLLILGAGAHGRAVADLAAECGWSVVGFTDRAPGPGVLGGDGDVVRAGAYRQDQRCHRGRGQYRS